MGRFWFWPFGFGREVQRYAALFGDARVRGPLKRIRFEDP